MARDDKGITAGDRTYKMDEKTLRKLYETRKTILKLIERMDSGELDKMEARAIAAHRIELIGRGGRIRTNSGPLHHLYLICRNGWLREATDKMLDLYPALRDTERWESKPTRRRGGRTGK